jgi:hypothetical protein
VLNLFACLVHESPECAADLVANLRRFDPGSEVLVYGPFEPPRGAHGHPSPRPQRRGRLHAFALDCMRWAAREQRFDAVTFVDSDQLLVRRGWSRALATALRARPKAGMFGSAPGRQPPGTPYGTPRAAYAELDLWRPFLRRFERGEAAFGHWTFWPGTVFTGAACAAITELVDREPALRSLLERTRIWATEEVVLPMLVALLGFETARAPGSPEFIRYGAPHTSEDVEAALARPDVFWMHPVARRLNDPARRRIRPRPRAAREVMVSCVMPTRARPAFARRAAAAFLAQDHPRRELIVVDDGPAPLCLPDDDRIVHLRLRARAPIGAKRNLAAEAARGEFIAHWDDDDWYAPWRLSAQLANLRATGADVCGLADLLYWEPAARRAWRYRWPADARPWLHDATLLYSRDLWQSEPQAHSDQALDCAFLWGGATKRLSALADERVYVGTIHAGNTSRKDTSGPLWSQYRVQDLPTAR